VLWGMGSERQMMRYLLGGLSDSRRAEIERRYFADEAYWERLQALELELFRDYARGSLPPWRRAQFERRCRGAPGLLERLESARTLESALPATQSFGGFWTSLAALFASQRLAFRLAAACAGLAVVASMAWLGVWGVGARRQLDRFEAARGAVAGSFVLTPGTPMSAGRKAQILEVPAGTGDIRLRLELRGGPPGRAYRVVVETVGRRQVWASGILQPEWVGSGVELSATLDSRLLPEGDYILTLQRTADSGGFADVDSYSFGVTQR